MSKKIGKFQREYQSARLLYNPGGNHQTLREFYKGAYSKIKVTIKEYFGCNNILKEINPYTHERIYKCERCDDGGIAIETIISVAEEKGGQLNNELFRCNCCSNAWYVDAHLTVCPILPTEELMSPQ